MGDIKELPKIKAPEWLNQDAKDAFILYARQLEEWGIWTPVHSTALAMMCYYQTVWMELCLEMENEELAVAGDKGTKKRNPKASLQKQAFEHFIQIAQRFGFTPMDKERITITERGVTKTTGKKASFR